VVLMGQNHWASHSLEETQEVERSLACDARCGAAAFMWSTAAAMGVGTG
jgi:hypothetical protein